MSNTIQKTSTGPNEQAQDQQRRELKEKAKDLGVSGISKIKKPDLIQILENEFIKLVPILKEKKSNDLKNICKQCGIKGVAGYKKDYLVCQILEYHSSILKFKYYLIILSFFK